MQLTIAEFHNTSVVQVLVPKAPYRTIVVPRKNVTYIFEVPWPLQQ